MRNNKILSILIPTYNRGKYLEKNIENLLKYIEENKFIEDVEIIISDNCSKDNTQEILEKYKENKIINLYKQIENIGLEKNVLFTLKKSNGKYCMFLGDDDYIENEYLKNIISFIKKEDITAIIPNNIPISMEGEIIGKSRDNNLGIKYYKKGFKSCLETSWRAHQMSGLCFRNENLYKKYNEDGINNIYPFIYFLTKALLEGDVYFVGKWPVKVTDAPQEKKDWSYGNDGLISEIFDNYKKIKKIYFWQRSFLEMKILMVQKWRYLQYKEKSIVAIKNIILGKNTSIMTKIIFPIYLLANGPLYFLKKIKRRYNGS